MKHHLTETHVHNFEMQNIALFSQSISFIKYLNGSVNHNKYHNIMLALKLPLIDDLEIDINIERYSNVKTLYVHATVLE